VTGSDARWEAEPVLTQPRAERRVIAVGELGIASLLRTDATVGVERAQARADELVEAARREGREFVDAARESARDAALAYGAAYRAALDAGWSAAELERMGYSPGTEAGRAAPGRRQAASGGPAVGDGTAPRVSFSGRSGARPSWRPISPRSRADDPEPG
jgi:hypothetical protein